MNNFKSYFLDPETDNEIQVNVSYEIYKGRKETLTGPAEETSAHIDVFINGSNFTSIVPYDCYKRLQCEALEHAANECETDYSKE